MSAPSPKADIRQHEGHARVWASSRIEADPHRLAPRVLEVLKIIAPETVIRWHRAGFRAYWRCKSRPLGGRPKTSADIRQLVREMSLANPFWGAPRIHGELLKLGIAVGTTINMFEFEFPTGTPRSGRDLRCCRRPPAMRHGYSG